MNSFGKNFRVEIFGESHGKEVGVLVDGCPAGMPLNEKSFKKDLLRRKGTLRGTTSRCEKDKPIIVSGIFKGKTTGSPLLIRFENTNIKSIDYYRIKNVPRPGHADFVALYKFGGFNDYRGGGHFSGRLTLGLVAAGVIAKQLIHPSIISAKIVEAGGDENINRAVEKAIQLKDTIGGIIECTADKIPVGLGEPFFDSLESMISHLIFSIPGIKGIEFGSGFGSARMSGSQHNDLFVTPQGKTNTNHAGGINGGISNGNPLKFRVAIKPTSSIIRIQKTVNIKTGMPNALKINGRHDVCFALRLPAIIEAALAIVLADLFLADQLISRIWKGASGRYSGEKI
jgi:chorismate synthase